MTTFFYLYKHFKLITLSTATEMKTSQPDQPNMIGRLTHALGLLNHLVDSKIKFYPTTKLYMTYFFFILRVLDISIQSCNNIAFGTSI